MSHKRHFWLPKINEYYPTMDAFYHTSECKLKDQIIIKILNLIKMRYWNIIRGIFFPVFCFGGPRRPFAVDEHNFKLVYYFFGPQLAF